MVRGPVYGQYIGSTKQPLGDTMPTATKPAAKGATSKAPAKSDQDTTPAANDPEPGAVSAPSNDGEAADQAETGEATNQNGSKTRNAPVRMFEVVDELPENDKPERTTGFNPQWANILKSVLTDAPEATWVKVTEYGTDTGARNAQKQLERRAVRTDEDGNPVKNKHGVEQYESPDYVRKTRESKVDAEMIGKMDLEVPANVTIYACNRRKTYRDAEGKVTKQASLLFLKWVSSN